METHARHVLVGLFTLAVTAAGFVFVYWLNTTGGLGERTVYRIRYENFVAGLLEGSAVLFNGVRVGEVTALDLDPEKPQDIVVTIAVEPETPVRTDTNVGIEFQGLTGSPAVSLSGGSAARLGPYAASGEPSLLVADPAAGQSMSGAARDALRRIDALVNNASVLGPSPQPLRPNILFILTDDQAATEMASMPNTTALIGGQGMTFTRAYIPYPLCCPSRVSMLTGEYMHNHQVRGNAVPFGGWEAFKPHESNTIATQLHDDGYYNVHIGKYVNGYAIGPPNPLPVPDGWDEWYGKVSEGPLYFNYSLIEKEGPADTPELVFYGDQENEYQTDVLGQKAEDFIDSFDQTESCRSSAEVSRSMRVAR